MFEFIHEIIETWILDMASQGLGPLRRSLMERHLNSCQRCRSFALDLIEFTHNLESEKASPGLSHAELGDMHASVIAAFQRELVEERGVPLFERAQGPAIRPSFIKALALAALIVAAMTYLGGPTRRANLVNSEVTVANFSSPHPVLIAAEASPTPTPVPSKTENK